MLTYAGAGLGAAPAAAAAAATAPPQEGGQVDEGGVASGFDASA
jgi:hypothetical protein